MGFVSNRWRWIGAGLVVVVCSVALLFVSSAQAQAPAPAASASERLLIRFDRSPAAGRQAQILNTDLVVRPGERISGDVTVFRGTARVESGGLISGNLLVFSGDIELAAGGVVDGDLLAYQGNVYIAGQVGGSAQSLSGDLILESTARVNGDVSVLAGELRRQPGAQIGGRVLTGPQLQMPELLPLRVPERPEAQPQPPRQVETGGAMGWWWAALVRLFWVGLTAAGLLGLALLIALLWPGTVVGVADTLQASPVLAFAVGLVLNSLALIPVGGLALTWAAWPLALCLAPLSVPLGLLALALELVGWTASGHLVGRRLLAILGLQPGPIWATALGVTALTGVVALCWLLNGCLGLIAVLILGAPGLGAVVLRWRARRFLAQADDLRQPGAAGVANRF